MEQQTMNPTDLQIRAARNLAALDQAVTALGNVTFSMEEDPTDLIEPEQAARYAAIFKRMAFELSTLAEVLKPLYHSYPEAVTKFGCLRASLFDRTRALGVLDSLEGWLRENPRRKSGLVTTAILRDAIGTM